MNAVENQFSLNRAASRKQIPISGSGIFSPANVAGMLSGLTYINVHSSTFGGGEIRGQNLLVPEPGSFALLGLGGIIFAMKYRRTSLRHPINFERR